MIRSSVSDIQSRFSFNLNALLVGHSSSMASGIAVAFSGGVDSTVLLDLTAKFCRDHDIPLFVFHVHHGLSPNADDWVKHCATVCAKYHALFQAVRVEVDGNTGKGIEASARSARYAALGSLCRTYGASFLLTAHHQDDQVETMLFQLLRGSGIAGLCGMDAINFAGQLLGNDKLQLVRPLLGESKKNLIDFAAAGELVFIEDESNQDIRYARNALRHQLMPVLAELAPGYSERLIRTSQHMQSASRLLKDLAKQDIFSCSVGDGLDIDKLQQLGEDRSDNLLRYWISGCGSPMPSTARLAEIKKQLFGAKEDARVSVAHDRLQVHRYRNKVFLSRRPIAEAHASKQIEFVWDGVPAINFPEFSGILHFEESGFGVPAAWLMQQRLNLHNRKGGERLKLAPNRPTRSIKSHYQTLQIPYWQRTTLPMLSIGRELLFAAGVGMQSNHCKKDETALIALRWEIAN